MAITAASVEANGWVLRLTLTGSLSSATVAGFALASDTAAQAATNFTAYALNPNGATPAMTLAATTSGFVPSGGTVAASSSVARALTVTAALRKPVNATAAGVRDAKNPDEVDNGDGTITVRLALSQHIYAGDAGLSLTALAGWRTGATAQTIAVTNTSTIAAPAPIVRWTDVPYQLQSGSFTLECAVASHHPIGLAPVAGVRFAVTDGTTVKTLWATALATSAAYSAGGTGQGLRVYSVTVDLATATALTKGLLRCDFKVFPWIGPARASDTGDTNLTSVAASNTPSMANLYATSATPAGLGTAAQLPFVVAYNPGNAWITPRFIDIDETNGTTTAASVTVATTAAAAAAGTPAANVYTALAAMYAANVTINDGRPTPSTVTRSADGLTLTLRKANGTTGCTGVITGTGGSNNYSGVNAGATFITVRGDPGDATARACIVRAATTSSPAYYPTTGKFLLHFTGLSIEANSGSAFTTQAYVWHDNIELRAASGAGATTQSAVSNAAGLWVTNAKWWQHGSSITQVNNGQTPLLVRNVAVERTINAAAVFNCARLPGAAAVATPATNAGIGNTGTTITDAGFAIDRMVVGCDLRYLNGAAGFTTQALASASAPAGLTLGKGSAYTVASRCAWLGNLCETFNGSNPLWASVGEFNSISATGTAAATVATENVIEGNTFTGDRTNNWYNLTGFWTIALNDSESNIVQVNRFANNIAFKNAAKHDRYNHTPIASQRIGVALTATRSRAYALGDQIVIAGAPANVYQCSQAGTTASSGGPSGTATGQTDGTAKWDWVATEARQHGYRPNATGGWSSLYGVMAEGNIDLENANDGPAQGSVGSTYTGNGTAGSVEFKFEFYGLGGQSLWADGINLTASPFTNDLSGGNNRQPYQTGSTTGGGNYKPLTTGSGTYLLGRGRTANLDVDVAGVARVVPFAAGALAIPVYAVVPAADRQASRAATPAVGWATMLSLRGGALATRAAPGTTGWAALLAPAGALVATRAAATLAGWMGQLRPAASAVATRAATTATGWATALGASGAVMATRAAATLTAWTAQLRPQPGALASRASPAALGWTTTLVIASDRSATLAAAGLIVWRGTLLPASTRSAMIASSPVATPGGAWSFVVDAGRIAISDRTLPILLPGTTTPPERTLIVTGDFRTMTVP